MQFPDSTLVALNLPASEPFRVGRMLAIALVLTIAAMSAAMLIEAEGVQRVINGATGSVHATPPEKGRVNG